MPESKKIQHLFFFAFIQNMFLTVVFNHYNMFFAFQGPHSVKDCSMNGGMWRLVCQLCKISQISQICQMSSISKISKISKISLFSDAKIHENPKSIFFSFNNMFLTIVFTFGLNESNRKHTQLPIGAWIRQTFTFLKFHVFSSSHD